MKIKTTTKTKSSLLIYYKLDSNLPGIQALNVTQFVCFFIVVVAFFLLLPREHHLVSSRPRHCAGANLAVHFGSSTHRFSVNCPR